MKIINHSQTNQHFNENTLEILKMISDMDLENVGIRMGIFIQENLNKIKEKGSENTFLKKKSGI